MSLAAALLVLSVCSLAQGGSLTLTARQAFSIPSRCTFTCASVTGIIFTPQDCDLIPELCCPSEEMLQLVSCYSCFNDDAVASTGKHLDNTRNQGIIDGLINSCDARGLGLHLTMSQITLPGQDPYRPGVHLFGNIPSSSSIQHIPPTSPLLPHTGGFFSPIHTIITPSHTSIAHPSSIPVTGFVSPPPTATVNSNQPSTNIGAAPRASVALDLLSIVPVIATILMVYNNIL